MTDLALHMVAGTMAWSTTTHYDGNGSPDGDGDTWGRDNHGGDTSDRDNGNAGGSSGDERAGIHEREPVAPVHQFQQLLAILASKPLEQVQPKQRQMKKFECQLRQSRPAPKALTIFSAC